MSGMKHKKFLFPKTDAERHSFTFPSHRQIKIPLNAGEPPFSTNIRAASFNYISGWYVLTFNNMSIAYEPFLSFIRIGFTYLSRDQLLTCRTPKGKSILVDMKHVL